MRRIKKYVPRKKCRDEYQNRSALPNADLSFKDCDIKSHRSGGDIVSLSTGQTRNHCWRNMFSYQWFVLFHTDVTVEQFCEKN